MVSCEEWGSNYELGDHTVEKGWSCCHCGLNQIEMKLQKINVLCVGENTDRYSFSPRVIKTWLLHHFLYHSSRDMNMHFYESYITTDVLAYCTNMTTGGS